jgi:hypothetical protein
MITTEDLTFKTGYFVECYCSDRIFRRKPAEHLNVLTGYLEDR